MVTTCGFPESRKFKLKEESKGEIFVGINQLRSELKILHCRRVCKCRRKYSVDELTSRPVDCRRFDCRRDDCRRFDMLPFCCVNAMSYLMSESYLVDSRD